MTDDEWDLVPTQDLIDVLKRRFSAFVLLGKSKVSDSQGAMTFTYDGCPFTCDGMVNFMKNVIQSQLWGDIDEGEGKYGGEFWDD